MNTNSNPPKYLVSRARQLCADPLFIHRTCIAAATYYDARSTEIKLPRTKADLREPHETMIKKAHKYISAASALGINEDSVDFRAVTARIKSSEDILEEINNIEGNIDINWSLRSLISRLLHVFNNFEVAHHKLPTFIFEIIDGISPPGDKAHGIESIRKLVAAAKI